MTNNPINAVYIVACLRYRMVTSRPVRASFVLLAPPACNAIAMARPMPNARGAFPPNAISRESVAYSLAISSGTGASPASLAVAHHQAADSQPLALACSPKSFFSLDFLFTVWYTSIYTEMISHPVKGKWRAAENAAFSLFMRFRNSNRQTYGLLEVGVTHTKQSLGLISNRQRYAFFSKASPIFEHVVRRVVFHR